MKPDWLSLAERIAIGAIEWYQRRTAEGDAPNETEIIAHVRHTLRQAIEETDAFEHEGDAGGGAA